RRLDADNRPRAAASIKRLAGAARPTPDGRARERTSLVRWLTGDRARRDVPRGIARAGSTLRHVPRRRDVRSRARGSFRSRGRAPGTRRRAALRQGRRDATLIVVDDRGERYAPATSIAPTLQAALDSWERIEPSLRALSDDLRAGRVESRPIDFARLGP